jgi:hypothetical protein
MRPSPPAARELSTNQMTLVPLTVTGLTVTVTLALSVFPVVSVTV